MTSIFGLAAAIIALALCILFKGGVILCLVAVLLGGAAFAMSFFKEKKFAKFVGTLCVIGACAALLFAGYRPGTHPARDVEVKISQVQRGHNGPKMTERLNELEEEYADYDSILYALAEVQISARLLQEASETLERVSENSARYYLLKEQMIVAANEVGINFDYYNTKDDYLRVLKDVAFEAMEECADWADGYTHAGMLTYECDKTQCVCAEYILAGALSINKRDGIAWYYLGLTKMYTGDTELAAEYFTRALRYKLPDPILANARYYSNLLKGGEAK